jgi:hypothetical protein
MTTRIWIEPVKRPDGRNWYSDRGLLLRTRLDGPDGEILRDRVRNAICETCRVLMSRGIVGQFETWKLGIGYPCMTGDIASTAGLTVHEPDDGLVHFARWRPFGQNAVSGSAVPAPAREDDGVGRREVAADIIASPRSNRRAMPEAAVPTHQRNPEPAV